MTVRMRVGRLGRAGGGHGGLDRGGGRQTQRMATSPAGHRSSLAVEERRGCGGEDTSGGEAGIYAGSGATSEGRDA